MAQLALEIGSRDDRPSTHPELVQVLPSMASNGKDIVRRATGRFYTHELIGRYLACELAASLDGDSHATRISVVDPFCGDGRLVAWLLQETHDRYPGQAEWAIDLWDCDGAAVKRAVATVEAEAARLGRAVTVRGRTWDTFEEAPAMAGKFDVVVTNPPWEQVKPDRRELLLLEEGDRAAYVESLKERSRVLQAAYPDAQPRRKFAGWGTNLARVGTDVAVRLTAPDGLCGVVSPASFLADTNSEALRRVLFESMTLRAVGYFPAEARLFDAVDVPCIAFVAQTGQSSRHKTKIARFSADHALLECRRVSLEAAQLCAEGWIVPVAFGAAGIELLAQMKNLPRFGDLEVVGEIWAGRELDETGKTRYLSAQGGRPFAKGVNIRRYGVASQPSVYVDEKRVKLPRSVDHPRLAWRDISRPNQRRRVQATLIPSGWVTGNSLGVAYDRRGNLNRLAALLAIFNSLVFEYQLRASLSTGHISLSSVRRVHIPHLPHERESRLAQLALEALDERAGAEEAIEVEVARAYELDGRSWELILRSYPKLTPQECDRLVAAWAS
jgi:Alw26I/Eco31I/Esp3I family type II restriction m6 adenine DNA methyltransferase